MWGCMDLADTTRGYSGGIQLTERLKDAMAFDDRKTEVFKAGREYSVAESHVTQGECNGRK
jgi:hypothetical protein